MAVGTRKPNKDKKPTKPAKADKPKKPAKAREAEAASDDGGDEGIAAIAGVIEAGFLAAMTDGELADAEIEAISDVIDYIFDGDITRKQIRGILQSCYEAFEADGYDGRMATIADRLPDNETRELALQVAAAVILSDGEYDAESEGQFFVDLASILGVSRRTTTSIWEDMVDRFS